MWRRSSAGRRSQRRTVIANVVGLGRSDLHARAVAKQHDPMKLSFDLQPTHNSQRLARERVRAEGDLHLSGLMKLVCSV
jgi:hypothetical protein